MNDSISREAVLDEIKARLRASGYGNVFVVSELNKLIEFVKQLPLTPPTQKGTWVKENISLTTSPPQYQWHCSECGRIVHWFTTEVLTDFCPSCGADMRVSGD